MIPEEERAPLALPSTQRFRIYQEVNNLRILHEGLKEEPLTLTQRNELVEALEENSKRTFTQIKKLLPDFKCASIIEILVVRKSGSFCRRPFPKTILSGNVILCGCGREIEKSDAQFLTKSKSLISG